MSDHLDRENTALRARVAELEAKILDMATLEVQRAADMGRRMAELEASIKAAKQAIADNDHHDAFLMLQAVLAKGREG